MSKERYSIEFKRDAVEQILGRGYNASDVSKRLGVSTQSLYAWIKAHQNGGQTANAEQQSAEIRRLKQELSRAIEERDILKKAAAYFAKEAK